MKIWPQGLLPLLICLIFLNAGNSCYSQISRPEWKHETALPADDIFSIRVINNRVYAGRKGRIFVSESGEDSWQTIAIPVDDADIEDIAKHGGKLYLAAYTQGVLESSDGGATWQPMPGSAGPFPIEFAESEGRLYVATGDRGVLRLEPETRRWQSFNEGLYDRIESTFDCLASANGTLVGGISANGAIAVRDPKSSGWRVTYPSGRLSPGSTTFDLLFAGARVWAFTNQNVFLSDNLGGTWSRAGNGLPLGIDSKGCAVGDSVYAIVNGKSGASLLYKRPAGGEPDAKWIPVDTLQQTYTYALTAFAGKLYVATQKGLYFTPILTGQKPEQPEIRNVSVYPNPASINLRIAVPGTAGGLFELYTPEGRRVVNERFKNNVHQMDISGLPTGSYIYRLSQSSGEKASGTLLFAR
nr:T9SS type A sorting domain-containing protein [uncultured Dyadobacter sp.]